MQRRAFLAAVGVVGLGGCVEDSASPTAGNSSEAPSGTSTRGGTPTPLDSENVLSVERRGTITVDASEAGEEWTYAEVRVENIWDQSIGQVTATAEWLDSTGTVAATTSEWTYAFAPGAIWRAFVPSKSGASTDSVEVALEPTQRTIDPGPLSASDHRMTVRGDATVVTGTVANAGEEAVFPTIFGKFFDKHGTIVGGATASANDVPADTSVEFELSFHHEQVGLSPPADYELLLDTPETRGTGCLC